ncbi:hypothetical protein BpHYR1_034062 [Brachionus plicatilis]|uniref:Uncharacterized protein n=1 Tax=Brachionus plicatilis TaxID=10195 RepID=A0A3M7PZX5_BRAPC|nr:hypothetical protein BpHYR1_034062 [Brachionus plicatilis]
MDGTQKIVITVRINNKSGKKVFKSITSVCFRLRVGLAVGLLVAGADKPMPFLCYRYLLLTKGQFTFKLNTGNE